MDNTDQSDKVPVKLFLQIPEAQVMKWAVKVAEDAVTVKSQEDDRVDSNQSANIIMMLSRVKNLLDEAITEAVHSDESTTTES